MQGPSANDQNWSFCYMANPKNKQDFANPLTTNNKTKQNNNKSTTAQNKDDPFLN